MPLLLILSSLFILGCATHNNASLESDSSKSCDALIFEKKRLQNAKVADYQEMNSTQIIHRSVVGVGTVSTSHALLAQSNLMSAVAPLFLTSAMGTLLPVITIAYYNLLVKDYPQNEKREVIANRVHIIEQLLTDKGCK